MAGAAKTTAADLGAFDSALLDLHNRERASVGLRPLIWSDTLARGAAAWAQHLAETGRFEHSRPDQRDGEGENLWQGTAGFYGPERMVGDWLAEKADSAAPWRARRIGTSWCAAIARAGIRRGKRCIERLRFFGSPSPEIV